MTASSETAGRIDPRPAPAEVVNHGARSRRALLGGLVGGAAAWAAASVGRVAPVEAANGDPLILGGALNATTQTTYVQSTTQDLVVFLGFSGNGNGSGVGLQGESSGTTGVGVRGVSGTWRGVMGLSTSGRGVHGESGSGWGIYGRSDSSHGVHGAGAVGVYGESGSGFGGAGRGVYGLSAAGVGVGGVSRGADQAGTFGHSQADATGVLAYSAGSGSALPVAKAKTGLYALASQDSASHGVWGESAAGQGVRGQATTGVGVFATASSGYALRTSGRLRVDKVSGVATIAAGRTSITVSPGVDITSTSFVLLTPRANIGSRGLWFTVDATNNRITIRLSSSRSSSTPVAWLLLG